MSIPYNFLNLGSNRVKLNTKHYIVSSDHVEELATLILPRWLWIVYCVLMVLFALLCMWAVYEFCHRLLITAKIRSNWSRTKGLDQKQRELIAVVSKYITLFLVASSSTLINFGVFSIFNYHGLDPGVLTGVDCIVNILCLFFHYSFAEKYYYRYCRRIDICCRLTMTWRLGKHDEAIKRQINAAKKTAAQTVDERQIRFSLQLDQNEVDETNGNIHREVNAEETQAMQPNNPPETKRVVSKSSDATGTGNTKSNECQLTPGSAMSPESPRSEIPSPRLEIPSPRLQIVQCLQDAPSPDIAIKQEQRCESTLPSEPAKPVTEPEQDDIKEIEEALSAVRSEHETTWDLTVTKYDAESHETSTVTILSDDWHSTRL